jgi:hypothetical protein
MLITDPELASRSTGPNSIAATRADRAPGVKATVVTDPEAPPLRPQRHVPNSIATLHRRAVYAIGQALLPRCPACARNFPRNSRRNI